MNLTAWVDVAIGLGVVYLGASLLVTVINEYIAQLRNLRGKQLFSSLNTLIADEGVKAMLAKSPALEPFFNGDRKKAPSYVDPNVLARLLVGGMAAGTASGSAFERASSAIDQLPDSPLRTQLQALVRTAGASTETLVKVVSDWANRSLTMLGESYKRHLQIMGFVVGLIVAIAANIDTVALTRSLYRNKDIRDATAALGVQIAGTGEGVFENCKALTPQQRKEDASCAPLVGVLDALQSRNETLGKLPIGWPLPATHPQATAAARSFDPVAWAIRLLGWLLTALALSLGAPFWFDVLDKLVNVRHGMRKPVVKDGT